MHFCIPLARTPCIYVYTYSFQILYPFPCCTVRMCLACISLVQHRLLSNHWRNIRSLYVSHSRLSPFQSSLLTDWDILLFLYLCPTLSSPLISPSCYFSPFHFNTQDIFNSSLYVCYLFPSISVSSQTMLLHPKKMRLSAEGSGFKLWDSKALFLLVCCLTSPLTAKLRL